MSTAERLQGPEKACLDDEPVAAFRPERQHRALPVPALGSAWAKVRSDPVLSGVLMEGLSS